jgi:hypothetical protein
MLYREGRTGLRQFSSHGLKAPSYTMWMEIRFSILRAASAA